MPGCFSAWTTRPDRLFCLREIVSETTLPGPDSPDRKPLATRKKAARGPPYEDQESSMKKTAYRNTGLQTTDKP